MSSPPSKDLFHEKAFRFSKIPVYSKLPPLGANAQTVALVSSQILYEYSTLVLAIDHHEEFLVI